MRKNKYLKIFLIFLLVTCMFVFFRLIITSSSYLFDLFYKKNKVIKKEMIDNYENKKLEISELVSFYDSLVPDSFIVYIEFKKVDRIDLWVYNYDSTKSNYKIIFNQWDINPYYYSLPQNNNPNDTNVYITFEEVKSKLGWKDSSFLMIKKHLDSANCISAQNQNPFEIGFRRDKTGKYCYYIFENELSEAEIQKWNNGCNFILYKNETVLGFLSSSNIQQCF